jgi:hypothetical protein
MEAPAQGGSGDHRGGGDPAGAFPGSVYEQRAAALIDAWGAQLRDTVLRLSARAREEAEDIVAEAQQLRQRP